MVKILTIDNFDREFKRLAKKYNSIKADLGSLLEELHNQPRLGTALGDNAYKIRLAISSKNKGKSSGARVITYFITDNNELYLLSIYDKSERAAISDKVLKKLIKNIP